MGFFLGIVMTGTPVLAILFYDTGDSTHNNSAPTGSYANSGWQYQGYFGSYLGTMISPTHFITAAHFGVNSSTFSHDAIFSGSATTNYTVDTAANGGQGYWEIGSTDLRVYQITGGTFSSYAPIYDGLLDVTSDFVVYGRGGPRGTALNLSPDGLKGWRTAGADGVARWGRNTFDSVILSGGSEYLVADFDAASGQDEASLSGGDSGGAAFVLDGGVWKLAGINYGIESFFDTNDTPGDGSEFSAALFDKGGYFVGNDGQGYSEVLDLPINQPSQLYLSRVSTSAAAIQSIISVPEPGSATLVFTALLVLAHRRREVK